MSALNSCHWFTCILLLTSVLSTVLHLSEFSETLGLGFAHGVNANEELFYIGCIKLSRTSYWEPYIIVEHSLVDCRLPVQTFNYPLCGSYCHSVFPTRVNLSRRADTARRWGMSPTSSLQVQSPSCVQGDSGDIYSCWSSWQTHFKNLRLVPTWDELCCVWDERMNVFQSLHRIGKEIWESVATKLRQFAARRKVQEERSTLPFLSVPRDNSPNCFRQTWLRCSF